MAQHQIHEDLHYLAGHLLHRGAQTDSERRAAEYIQQRLRESTPNVQVEEFQTIDNYTFLFASYFSEFLVVTLIALWWPIPAAVYGTAVFGCYLAEFSGHYVLARLLPHFESQNVVARYLGLRPKKLIVVTAHYDSGNATPLARPGLLRWLRPLHQVLVFCMVLIIATCVTEGMGWLLELQYPLASTLRWGSTAVLAAAALVLLYASGQSEDIRGAIGNASGVAALLALGERLQAQPVDDADVWLAATGSQESWMSGMRSLLDAHSFDKRHTCIVNMESIGAGHLSYATRECLLHTANADPTLVREAQALHDTHGVQAVTLQGVPTGAHIPLHRGLPAMSILGVDDNGLPPHWNRVTDRLTEVDEPSVEKAVDFAEALIRRLAATP